MAGCALLVLIGVAAVVAWGATEFQEPEPTGGPERTAALAARRYVWSLTVAVVAGAGAGILVAGAGGRLVMRLLAATAGDAAQGRETEAEEIVGRISTGGTLGFIVFIGLFVGLSSGALYVLVRRWLPAGRLGGLAYGALLLVVAGTRVDPLRADNPDFDIVGPGWLAAAAFGGLALLHGMLVATLAARYSRLLPLVPASRRSVAAYAPLVVLLPLAPALPFVTVAGVVVVALSRLTPVVRAMRSRTALVTGRVLLAAIGLVALPGCVAAVVDVAGRRL